MCVQRSWLYMLFIEVIQECVEAEALVLATLNVLVLLSDDS